ncbi:hypothetical protein SAMN02982929_05862 [Saccharopolyspora kobensis]|uniref:Uncharacterized protein n=1 Tax=Saccharopolyspora kobensis TaxID=146035 RepID=A0A1H6E8L0_9PSEU|nr:hypothetical protein [Saccharopolyspora kobensis]SEG93611.1 hypothetical protein SAMN02982929_05862 [Saccharopolyspora kobensis]SFD46522.1 hypothetical protein SAMN05216506_104393 [Saccharopolyspora kobensis]
MPIRTHRGRAAVYRRLWGWPLRSPKHLAAAVVALAVVATLVGFVLPEPPPSQNLAEPATSEPPAHSAVVPPTPTKAPPTISVPADPPAQTPPDPAGVAVVEEWGKAWVDHPVGADRQQWLAKLRPYTTDEFITEMASVDPANAGNVITGVATAVSSTGGAMQVRLPTDIGVLQVTVTKTRFGWRVAQYDKEG